MTSLEFYQRYCVIKNTDGTTSAPTIMDIDKVYFEVIDVAHELKVPAFIRNYARLNKPRYTINPIVEQEMVKRKNITSNESTITSK